MAVGDIYQLTLTWDVDGQRLQNVLHFKEATACTETIPAREVIEAFHPHFEPSWKDVLAIGVVLTSYYCRRVRPSPSIPVLLLPLETLGIVGTRPDAIMAPTAGQIISFYSDLNEATGRGRLYIGGMSESDQQAGQLTEAAAINLDELADQFTSPIEGPTSGTWDPCVYSRKDNAGTKIIHAVANTNLATQRSRRAYPGLAT